MERITLAFLSGARWGAGISCALGCWELMALLASTAFRLAQRASALFQPSNTIPREWRTLTQRPKITRLTIGAMPACPGRFVLYPRQVPRDYPSVIGFGYDRDP